MWKHILSLTAFCCLAAGLQAGELQAVVKPDRVTFLDGQAVITEYFTAQSVAKPYFWPVNAPGEIPVTRAWPMAKGTKGETTDHVHQKSAWFCHGDVIPAGLELKTRSADQHVKGVDFWSEAKGHGKIVVTEVGKPSVVDGEVQVATKNDWRSADDDTILQEERTIRVSRVEAGYLIALDVKLLATNYTVTFGDTKEGSMGIRIADDLRCNLATGGTITSATGAVAKPGTKGTLKLWGELADWHDYSGSRNEQSLGLAVFDHTKNAFRSAWHTRDYGLMAANPFGRKGSGFPSQKNLTELVQLKKGDSLVLHYALYAHTGDAETGKVAAAYHAFIKSTK